MNPRIVCICPTYKRPESLRNLIACYEAQKYENRQLLILDDVPQHLQQQGDRWALLTNEVRYPHLPAKFNDLIEIASAGFAPDIVVVMEDDDIYLPDHLNAIAEAWAGPGVQFFAPSRVFSNYGQNRQGLIEEDAYGRFHASWAYTRELLDLVGGYPVTERLDFDQQMHARARQAAGGITHYSGPTGPTYAYRWGNPTYHGSAQGEAGYAKLWEQLAHWPVPWIRSAIAFMDEETRRVYASRGYGVGVRA